ncbi:sporulation integral membrane protein YtvI [Sediminibacillus halophilus]|uniref:Sporulation integral membrane protein YtvI n=1 Tax=Sediminibacillus halophilus TaxID=482461 RepID=A0A1G9Y9A9_9BACI|nr:sporulation integral membrane protein YtvI [Sediminibacillus halophilus]SDN05600.1 sporulation integral membrane protein YtvI [Sediminibacillus halophilus]
MSTTLLNKWLRFILVIACALVGTIVLYYVVKYTYPFVIAVLIAIMLNPVISFLERLTKLPRAVSVVLVLAGFLVLVSGLVAILIVELINGTSFLAARIPGQFKELIRFTEEFASYYLGPIYEKMNDLVDMLEPSQQDLVTGQLKKLGEDIAAAGALVIQHLLQAISQSLIKLPSYFSIWLFSLLGTFFICKDWYKLKAAFFRFLPSSFTTSTSTLYQGLKQAFLGYLKAQLLLIFITFLLVWTGLLLLKVDYALTVAFITALIDLLPYVGTGIIFLPWIVYVFFTGNYSLTIGLTVLYGVVVIQRQISEPKILSANIGVNPLAMLVCLFVGFQLFGLWGLIAGPVVLVMVTTFIKSGLLTQLWIFVKG